MEDSGVFWAKSNICDQKQDQNTVGHFEPSLIFVFKGKDDNTVGHFEPSLIFMFKVKADNTVAF
jgi:hypothetical protein